MTVKPSIFQRYLITLNKYKWLALATFLACVGVSGVAAIQTEPLPKYIGVGGLTSNRPSATFSNTANTIIEQGKQLPVEALLADNVIKAVADRTKEPVEKVRKNTLLRPPSPQRPTILQIFYRNDDAKIAAAGAEGLMLAMVEKSRLMNNDRLQQLLADLDKRQAQLRDEIKAAEQKLSQGEEKDKARLQQELAGKKALVEKMQATLTDARAAQAEITSSLAIAQAPQVLNQTGLNPVFTTLGTGILAGLLLSGGLILVLALMGKYPNPKELRQKLLEAYKGRCPVSGCEVEEAIEVAIIDPYTSSAPGELSNALILRSDLVKLFEAKLLAIEPPTLTVRLAPEIAKTSYSKLAGRRLQLTENEAARPSIDALEAHCRKCQWLEERAAEVKEKA